MDIPMQDLLTKVSSRFKLVVLAARRAEELNIGAQNLIEASPKIKPAIVALKEIQQGRISYKQLK